jgi:hypothetical protein
VATVRLVAAQRRTTRALPHTRAARPLSQVSKGRPGRNPNGNPPSSEDGPRGVVTVMVTNAGNVDLVANWRVAYSASFLLFSALFRPEPATLTGARGVVDGWGQAVSNNVRARRTGFARHARPARRTTCGARPSR